MSELLNRLFGIGTDGQLGFGSPDAALRFVHTTPAWGWAFAIALILGAVWWSYRSIPGHKAHRAGLGICRSLILILLFALALGPMIEQSTIRTEQDWAIVLLDRSGSLDTRDTVSNNSLTTRNDQLLSVISETNDDTNSQWAQLADRKQVVWLGFDETTSSITTGLPPKADAIAEPSPRGTLISQAIGDALDEASARPISSIVLVSDGQSIDTIDSDLLNTLIARQIPVYAVPLGNDQPIRDLGIEQVEYPRAAFADDLVPFRAMLSSSGMSLQDLQTYKPMLQLVDHATNEVIASTPIEPKHLGLSDQSSATPPSWITLSTTQRAVGQQSFDLIIKSQSPDADLNSTNNQRSVQLNIVDRPMRVLYIDGYPRWEHRYLKNLLLRERSISSSSMLLATSRRYVQEGDELIASLPTTLEEWEPFDVIILGDVRPQLFSDQQLETLVEHISDHGAGLLWIAGPSANPVSWLDTPLASLLPMRSDAGGSQRTFQPWNTPVTMQSTPEADRLGLLGLNDARTGWLDRISNPDTGWSQLQWALNLDQSAFKPGASVLASARSTISNEQSPLITMMRFSSGRSIFMGTDEIWRWRYGRGEDLPERFYLPLIRSLGRGTVDRRAAPASLTISPTNPTPGKPAQITLRLFDQARIDTMPGEITIEIKSESSQDEPTTITLRGSADTRVANWIPDHPGVFTASMPGVDLEFSQIIARARVLDESAENRTLNTNHELLANLAEQTGGLVVAPDDFNTIPALMPNRTRTITSPPKQASLWDRPVVLIALVLLFTVEWIGRRILRLA